jgi:D-aminopeptidase
MGISKNDRTAKGGVRMSDSKRIRDFGIIPGRMKPGMMNCLTDVPGVTVAHVTLSDGPVQTGVTAIMPHTDNLYRHKVMGAVDIINGFGKSIGLMQVEELGTIETPILLTNTLSVGLAADALVDYMLQENPEIGTITGTVNPLVCECNDGYLNDIRGRHITKFHILEAIKNAKSVASSDPCNTGITIQPKAIPEGNVGAGAGMSCYHLKGGIGTASRIMEFTESIQKEEEKQSSSEFILGVLVLTNFGKRKDLIIDGKKIGPEVTCLEETDRQALMQDEPEKGSVIVVLGTNLPVSERQLKRISRRAVVGLVRTGSHLGTGSGDVVLAFSTANGTEHFEEKGFNTWQILNEDKIDIPFRAAAEATEEAVLNSLAAASYCQGREGHYRAALKEYLERIPR